MNKITLENIRNARNRIERIIRKTPLIHSNFISKICGGNVYIKLENQQITNAFKIRGAFNRISLLNAEERILGIVTASSGNHAQGIALASQLLGIKAKIVVPTNISKVKLDKLKNYEVSIVQEGSFDVIEKIARELSKSEGLIYISP